VCIAILIFFATLWEFIPSFLPYESPASKLLMMMMMMMSPFSCFCFFDSELGNVMGERWMKALTLTV